jgi:hypothetical protein
MTARMRGPEMRRLLTGIAALLLALLVLPAFADDKDKDKKDPVPDAKKDADKKDAPDAKKDADKPDAAKNTEKTIKAGAVVGKVVEVNETAKSIKVEVTYEITKPNVGEIQAMESDQIQLAQAAARRDFNAVANYQRSILNHQLHSTTVEQHTKQVDIVGKDDLKIRLTDPPAAYDDKGNLKKRTDKELKELKGDPKLPGYPAGFSDLHQGSMVRASLVKPKDAPTHSAPKGKDADPEPLSSNLPEASIIEILSEPAPKK